MTLASGTGGIVLPSRVSGSQMAQRVQGSHRARVPPQEGRGTGTTNPPKTLAATSGVLMHHTPELSPRVSRVRNYSFID